jgi:hypothetical protein
MKKGFLDGRIITEAKEQKELLASLKEKQDFVLIVQELQKYQDFNVDNLVVSVALEGDQINFDGKLTNVKAVTFKNPEKTVSISYVKVDDFEQVHESFTGKVVQEQIYKGFKAKLGEVLPTFTKEYNGELETEPKLTDFPNNPNYSPGKTIEGQALDWIDGKFCLENEDAGKTYRHCGPGCGDGMSLGGGTPINSIDSCCRAHDRCWHNFGEGDKCCDKELANCIDPYQNQDYWSWLQINTYFEPRGWLC